MPVDLVAVTLVLLCFAVVHAFARGKRPARALTLVLLVGSTGCDGCSPASTAGPLRPDENTRFHVTDRLGSTALVLDHRGEIIARDAHAPNGESWVEWRAQGERGPTYAYSGEERDPGSGSVAIGARHYLPALGRWASPDPLFLSRPEHRRERPDERNLYRYAANNPTTYVDPTGTSIWTKLAKAGAKLAKGASVADSVKGTIDDARTLLNPRKSTLERIGAGISLASEVLPLSLGDLNDIRKGVKRLLGKTTKGVASDAASSGAKFIGTQSGASIHRSQKEAVASIQGAGATRVGATAQTRESGEIFHMSTPGGPAEIRVMQGRAGGGPYQGPRTIVTRPGTREYVHPNGNRIEGAVPKSERKQIGHTHGQTQ